jgi:hypothetical protein
MSEILKADIEGLKKKSKLGTGRPISQARFDHFSLLL